MSKTIYLVKSFGAFGGYQNLKAFYFEEQAEQYAKTIEEQIPEASLHNGEEFVEVEEITLEESVNA